MHFYKFVDAIVQGFLACYSSNVNRSFHSNIVYRKSGNFSWKIFVLCVTCNINTVHMVPKPHRKSSVYKRLYILTWVCKVIYQKCLNCIESFGHLSVHNSFFSIHFT